MSALDPLPVIAWPTWMERAACAELDPELFFATEAHAGDRLRALTACMGCPVRQQCLDHARALERATRLDGIWGGMTAAQRRATA